MGGRQGDGGKGFLEDGQMMEVLAQRDLWGPGGSLGVKGQGWASMGPPNATCLALSPVGVQKGCAPTGAGRREVPAGHKNHPGQALRALPHISASLGAHQPGSKHSKTDFCTSNTYGGCSRICDLTSSSHF